LVSLVEISYIFKLSYCWSR